jgi:hypothetical protein
MCKAEGDAIYRVGHGWFGWVRGAIQSLCNRCQSAEWSETDGTELDGRFETEEAFLDCYDRVFPAGSNKPGVVRIPSTMSSIPIRGGGFPVKLRPELSSFDQLPRWNR